MYPGVDMQLLPPKPGAPPNGIPLFFIIILILSLLSQPFILHFYLCMRLLIL